jgi:hypothetical protein
LLLPAGPCRQRVGTFGFAPRQCNLLLHMPKKPTAASRSVPWYISGRMVMLEFLGHDGIAAPHLRRRVRQAEGPKDMASRLSSAFRWENGSIPMATAALTCWKIETRHVCGCAHRGSDRNADGVNEAVPEECIYLDKSHPANATPPNRRISAPRRSRPKASPAPTMSSSSVSPRSACQNRPYRPAHCAWCRSPARSAFS